MSELKKHWAGILFRGILALLFGVVTLFWPGLGFEFLILFFGAYCLVDGILAILMSFSYRSWGLIFKGVLGVIVGCIFFFYTFQAAELFIMIVGIWAIFSGIFEIFGAVFLRKQIPNEIFMLLLGMVSILFGSLIFINPLIAGLAFTLILGIYAIVVGTCLIAFALKLRSAKTSSPAKKKKK